MKDKLKKLWRAWQEVNKQIAETNRARKNHEICDYCLEKPACDMCNRCSNRSCNAGCIFCK